MCVDYHMFYLCQTPSRQHNARQPSISQLHTISPIAGAIPYPNTSYLSPTYIQWTRSRLVHVLIWFNFAFYTDVPDVGVGTYG
jgi:hypothetical protein